MTKPKKVINRPIRDPDHISKRGVPYWWAPEWIRATHSSGSSYGKIAAIRDTNGHVSLHMKSKQGKYTYIQGSIQQEFQDWHTDRKIDYILLGIPEEEIIVDESDE